MGGEGGGERGEGEENEILLFASQLQSLNEVLWKKLVLWLAKQTHLLS